VGNALGVDDAPEIRNHVGIAETAGGGNDQSGAGSETRQARAEGAADVK
jgi:hypothetical protein